MKSTRPVSVRQSGFTLIEIMVVVVILGVLAALVVPSIMSRRVRQGDGGPDR